MSSAENLEINKRQILLLYKWTIRRYVTPIKVNKETKFQISASNAWFRKEHCLIVFGNPVKLTIFWEEVKRETERIILKTVPALFILKTIPSQKNNRLIIHMCLSRARRSIAIFWKNLTKPSIKHWVEQMIATL